MNAQYEVATILQKHQEHLPQLVPNGWKHRTLFALSRCRTAAMGGHIDRCKNPNCKRLHLSYNSCRNRHCPKCQGHQKERWIAAREAALLNCTYFHVVFTLPHALNAIAIREPAVYYRTLFKVCWHVLKGFGANPKFLGAELGMIAILHTWGQNMSLHPHLHCIVPGGGVTKAGKWKPTKGKGKYLFPVKEVSKVFRAQFVSALAKEVALEGHLRECLFSKRWVVYAKCPFYGPKQVVEYLGRYTHKIAISNHRIVSVQDGNVQFTAKDYRHGGRKRVLTLDQAEFIRRFSMHVLPKGFTRIRHYGLLSSGKKKEYKQCIDAQIGAVVVKIRPTQHRICPVCKVGAMETIYTFDQRGPPANWFTLFRLLA